jgi:hypothetical protein
MDAGQLAIGQACGPGQGQGGGIGQDAGEMGVGWAMGQGLPEPPRPDRQQQPFAPQVEGSEILEAAEHLTPRQPPRSEGQGAAISPALERSR